MLFYVIYLKKRKNCNIPEKTTTTTTRKKLLSPNFFYSLAFHHLEGRGWGGVGVGVSTQRGEKKFFLSYIFFIQFFFPFPLQGGGGVRNGKLGFLFFIYIFMYFMFIFFSFFSPCMILPHISFYYVSVDEVVGGVGVGGGEKCFEKKNEI